MPSTSFLVHIFSLLFFLWAAYQIVLMQEERKFLIKILSLQDKKDFFLVKSPLSYCLFLGRLLGIPVDYKFSGLFLPRQKIKADRLFFFLKTHRIAGIQYKVCSKPTKDDRISIDVECLFPDYKLWEKYLSQDLGVRVYLNQPKP